METEGEGLSTGILGNLTAPCNENCDCSSTIYTSICGRDDTEYFSACYAGCRDVKHLYNEKCFYEELTNTDYFIASVPVPLMFHKASTESCIYWSINKCGIRGRCWIYDSSKLIYLLMGLCK
ncbi:Solute carrier organic anion transporter family member 6C1 [Lemmus lemmus]